jgi:YD repeat-containing protein
VLQRGRSTRFDAPDAIQQTNPFGVNNHGVIVGKDTTADGVDHGFRRDARGRVVTIDLPGAPEATAEGINDRGQIVGARFNDLDLTGARGFLLAKGVKGPFTPIDVPGAPRNLVRGLNDRGQLVGSYENTNNGQLTPVR